MRTQELVLDGPEGHLQAALEGDLHAPSLLAIICHPHPLFGGNMNNKVVTTLGQAAAAAGAAVLRFNFRGVGASQGAYSDGVGETEDLIVAHNWLARRYPHQKLWLAGFSFGCYPAACGAQVLAANSMPAASLFLVAPPVHQYRFQAVETAGCPVTVVQGDDDEVVPAGDVYRWSQHTPLTPDLIRFPTSGHFYHGHLDQLKEVALSRLPL